MHTRAAIAKPCIMTPPRTNKCFKRVYAKIDSNFRDLVDFQTQNNKSDTTRKESPTIISGGGTNNFKTPNVITPSFASGNGTGNYNCPIAVARLVDDNINTRESDTQSPINRQVKRVRRALQFTD